MAKKRSKQNNPEQKTNSQDVEFGQEADQIKKAKKKYQNTGGQPVKSKFHPEPEQSR